MRKWILSILFLAVLVLPVGVRADYWASSMTARTGLGYSAQQWFFSGLGKELQADKIKEYWDKGYRITSAAHTSNGWTVVMSTGSQYTMQTYHYGEEWPLDWLEQKRKEGYVMTDITQGPGKWFIVMSQCSAPVKDYWIAGEWTAELRQAVQRAWDGGFSIDNVCSYTGPKGSDWIVHFVNKPERQVVKWSDGGQPYEDVIDEMYKEGYVIDIIEVGSTDEMMLVFTKREGTMYRWGTNMDEDGLGVEAQNIYNLNGHVARVGGGLIKVYGSHSFTGEKMPISNDPKMHAAAPVVHVDTKPVPAVRVNDDPPYTFEFKQYEEWVDGKWKIRYAPAKLVIEAYKITLEYGNQTWTAEWNDISTDDELTKELFHDLRLGMGEKVALVFRNIEFRAVDESGYVFLKMNLMSCKDESDLDPMRRLFTKVVKDY